MAPSDLREQLQSALGSGYTVERELGGGGMSRVFVAMEARFGRRVVVKVLAPELTEGMSAARFEREVRLAARLQHPNVVPVLAAGERSGLAYFTMPYVEGESLRAMVAREGRLPLDAAVSILRDVARALEHAHAHGVVHRDVKPDNILVAGSAATVADFGIAKALQAAQTVGTLEPGDHDASGATLTRVGVSLGTPAYMAPEQAAGDPDVDARADRYAWGVVAYELLAGAPPFTGRAAHQLVAAHIGELPPPLGGRVASVPPGLAALVMRCLEKDPARRPQSAGELLIALEGARTPSGAHVIEPTSVPRRHARIVIGLLAALLLVVAGAALVRARRPTAPVRPVLAVLPFENLGPAADAYFADGVTEVVRGRLTRVPGLGVIGARSVEQYRGSSKQPRAIARELGATHLLTGTVRWERAPGGGGRVRVNPDLVRAADQTSLWAEPVEGSLEDVFTLQTRVAERVERALEATLGRRHERVVAPTPPTTNVAAYDAYLRGLAHAAEPNRFSASERRSAIVAFERAVALDPQFAEAHARLSLAYLTERAFGYDSGAMLARAQASLSRALALDSTNVASHLARASYLRNTDDPMGAYREYLAAARLAPGDAEVLHALGWTQEALGRLEEALATYRRVEALEPRWADAAGSVAGAYDRLFRYEEAVQAHGREIALSHEPFSYVFQAGSYLLWRADTAAARRALAEGDPDAVADLLTRLPSHFAGRMIWRDVVPATVLRAKDTITLAGYTRGDWGTPDLYHLMKTRHFAMSGAAARSRAHADSVIALLEPVVRRGPGVGVLVDIFTPRATLAEAYAYGGRATDGARVIDQYVDAKRRQRNQSALDLPYALVTAAYVDVLIGRRDLAVARLEEALRLPSGQWISRALLRADPSWAPLRGHPAFERLVAGR